MGPGRELYGIKSGCKAVIYETQIYNMYMHSSIYIRDVVPVTERG